MPQDISYEEWIIEERLRMKTGKSRRAMLTEDGLTILVEKPQADGSLYEKMTNNIVG